MDNKQQTAVEWFIQELQKTRDYQRVINQANQSTSAVRDVVEQAKEMEKDRMIQFARYVLWKTVATMELTIEQHYNETYGNDKQ
jgi:hypothetical protein